MFVFRVSLLLLRVLRIIPGLRPRSTPSAPAPSTTLARASRLVLLRGPRHPLRGAQPVNETGAGGQGGELSSVGGRSQCLSRQQRRGHGDPDLGERRSEAEPGERDDRDRRELPRAEDGCETDRDSKPAEQQKRQQKSAVHRVAGKVVGAIEHAVPRRSQPGGDARGRLRDAPGGLSGGEHVGVPLTGEQLELRSVETVTFTNG